MTCVKTLMKNVDHQTSRKSMIGTNESIIVPAVQLLSIENCRAPVNISSDVRYPTEKDQASRKLASVKAIRVDNLPPLPVLA
mmetsp:Transcript_17487/g.42722  ORF Transcript_17487/g.42722 Transcript_17487/m.42722 type:complete len:82 (+) Transcript_17487:397-642(+)